MSDHEPVRIDFRISVQSCGVQARSFVSKIAWQRACSDQLDVYATALRDALSKLAIPHAAIVCSDVHCQDPSHRACLYKYINELSEACLTAAKHTLPYTSLRSTKGRIPGWPEHVEPAVVKKPVTLFFYYRFRVLRENELLSRYSIHRLYNSGACKLLKSRCASSVRSNFVVERVNVSKSLQSSVCFSSLSPFRKFYAAYHAILLSGAF